MILQSPRDLPSETPIVAALERVVQERARAGDVVETHLHHFHQLDVILSGCFLLRLEERRTIPLRPGDAFLTPPLMRHAYRAEESVRHVVFKFHLAPRYWPVWGTKTRHAPLPHGLVDTIAEWATQAERRTAFVPHQCLALATLCLIELARRQPESQPRDVGLDAFRGRLLPLLERIANEPYADWAMDRLAQEAHMSARHFSRCFHRLVGQTPKHYLLEARMRAAAGEIAADTSRPLKEISQRAGYATVHAFTHAFTNFCGVSPGAYRRRPVTL